MMEKGSAILGIGRLGLIKSRDRKTRNAIRENQVQITCSREDERDDSSCGLQIFFFKENSEKGMELEMTIQNVGEE